MDDLEADDKSESFVQQKAPRKICGILEIGKITGERN